MHQATGSIRGNHLQSQPAENCRGAFPGDTTHSLATILREGRFVGGNDILFRGLIEGSTSLRSAKTTTKAGGDSEIAVGDKNATPGPWEGQLVVYQIGESDPMKVVAEALAMGAAGILTEQLLPCSLPQCIVPEVDSALARIESACSDRPDRKLLTIGVVGSAGKTSTCLLIAAVLRQAGIRTAYLNDLGTCDGVLQSTPESLATGGRDLVRWLAESADAQSLAAVVELSDVELRRGAVETVEFDVLVTTGIAVTSDDFGQAALECALDLLADDGVVLCNADDQAGARIVADSGVRTVSFGMRRNADVSAKVIDQSGGMTTLMVSHDDTTVAMETSLCGSAMAANHLAAIGVGLLVDRPLPVVTEAVSAIRELPGRVQRLPHENAADVILDVARNPVQVTAALRTARALREGGRLWCVVAIDGQHSAEELSQFGHALERFADHAIVTSTPNSKRDFLKRSHEVLDGVQECAAFRLVADQQRAIDWTLAEAKQRDVVLLITDGISTGPREQRNRLEFVAKSVEKAADFHVERPAFRVVRADG
ncbi:MAG: Mur ligase family protein [Planctomycetota bacterium]